MFTKKEGNILIPVLLSILAIVLVVGCMNPKAPGTTSKQYGDFEIKTIDGCEYLEYDSGILDQRVYSLTHKGNCKNKIHK